MAAWLAASGVGGVGGHAARVAAEAAEVAVLVNAALTVQRSAALVPEANRRLVASLMPALVSAGDQVTA